MQLITRSLKTKTLTWKGVVLGHHQSLNLQILSLTTKNKMPIMMKTNLQICFPLLFPSTPPQNTDNIQLSSISLQSTANIQGFILPLSGHKEEPSCSRDFFSPSNGRKVFCPICNNAFSINTKEEHADLCLESKTEFFFEKHTESSDEGE